LCAALIDLLIKNKTALFPTTMTKELVKTSADAWTKVVESLNALGKAPKMVDQCRTK
jgi:hypothetical protein